MITQRHVFSMKNFSILIMSFMLLAPFNSYGAVAYFKSAKQLRTETSPEGYEEVFEDPAIIQKYEEFGRVDWSTVYIDDNYYIIKVTADTNVIRDIKNLITDRKSEYWGTSISDVRTKYALDTDILNKVDVGRIREKKIRGV